MRDVSDDPELNRLLKDEDADMRYAAGAMVGWYGAQVPATAKQALKRYRKFRSVKPFWN